MRILTPVYLFFCNFLIFSPEKGLKEEIIGIDLGSLPRIFLKYIFLILVTTNNFLVYHWRTQIQGKAQFNGLLVAIIYLKK